MPARCLLPWTVEPGVDALREHARDAALRIRTSKSLFRTVIANVARPGAATNLPCCFVALAGKRRHLTAGQDAILSLREDVVASWRCRGGGPCYRPDRPGYRPAARAQKQERTRPNGRRDPRGRTPGSRIPRGGDRLACLPPDPASTRLPGRSRGGETTPRSGCRAPIASPTRALWIAGCPAAPRGAPRPGGDVDRPPALDADGPANRRARSCRRTVCPPI